MDRRFLPAGMKEIPVFDIPVYIIRADFRYYIQMHNYCNYFVKLEVFYKIFNSFTQLKIIQAMKSKILTFLLAFTYIINQSEVCSQVPANLGQQQTILYDSISGKRFIVRTLREKPDIRLSKGQAIKYLQHWYQADNWNNPADPLRQSIGQLIFYASNNPFDSTRFFIDRYSFDSINIPWDRFYLWDTMRVKIPVISPAHFTLPRDSVLKVDTTFKKIINDSLKFRNAADLNIFLSTLNKQPVNLKDTIILIAKDTLQEVTSDRKSFPFSKYDYPYESDSILVAINSLVSYINDRDSSIVNLSGTSNLVTPVWLNSKSNRFIRFWLRNESADSVTIWVGSTAKNTLGLFLEEGIIFRRPTKQSKFSDAQLNLKEINSKNLQEVKKAEVKPIYWKLRTEASFILNQASLTNWVKGGESSISTAMDITGFADYNNKPKNTSSNNYIRLKYGLIGSGTPITIRKNLDLLETNSKLNHKAFGKFDFSAIMLFKTQIAKGYNYPNDSVPVSKFLNPATLTIGLGLDYKPGKKTSINFSPLSYKATFVTDTLHIDQTLYGVPRNRKSLHEPGASLLFTNEFQPIKTVNVINRLQLYQLYTQPTECGCGLGNDCHCKNKLVYRCQAEYRTDIRR